MTKYYCDRCQKEVPPDRCGRLSRQLTENGKRFTIEVMHCINSTWNGGILCHDCVIEIVNNGEELMP